MPNNKKVMLKIYKIKMNLIKRENLLMRKMMSDSMEKNLIKKMRIFKIMKINLMTKSLSSSKRNSEMPKLNNQRKLKIKNQSA